MEALLSGRLYTVRVLENQISFVNKELFFTELVFERPTSLNNTPGTWQFVGWESDFGSIPVSSFVDAYNFLQENFGKDFESYKGELRHFNNGQ